MQLASVRILAKLMCVSSTPDTCTLRWSPTHGRHVQACRFWVFEKGFSRECEQFNGLSAVGGPEELLPGRKAKQKAVQAVFIHLGWMCVEIVYLASDKTDLKKVTSDKDKSIVCGGRGDLKGA